MQHNISMCVAHRICGYLRLTALTANSLSKEYTPTFRGWVQFCIVFFCEIGSSVSTCFSPLRGFHSFYGFYSGGEDYFQHRIDGIYDLHRQPRAKCGKKCSQVDWNAAPRWPTKQPFFHFDQEKNHDILMYIFVVMFCNV